MIERKSTTSTSRGRSFTEIDIRLLGCISMWRRVWIATIPFLLSVDEEIRNWRKRDWSNIISPSPYFQISQLGKLFNSWSFYMSICANLRPNPFVGSSKAMLDIYWTKYRRPGRISTVSNFSILCHFETTASVGWVEWAKSEDVVPFVGFRQRFSRQNRKWNPTVAPELTWFPAQPNLRTEFTSD